jgi:hypothetical protein
MGAVELAFEAGADSIVIAAEPIQVGGLCGGKTAAVSPRGGRDRQAELPDRPGSCPRGRRGHRESRHLLSAREVTGLARIRRPRQDEARVPTWARFSADKLASPPRVKEAVGDGADHA